jgi:prepilin-type N-terminal cleavage/methylation domain-containing protein
MLLRRPSLRRPTSTSGFSLLEIVIALAVIAMIVGVVAVRSGGVINKGKTSRVIQLIDTLKKASAQYHADTNQMPWEHAGGSLANRKLSGTQTIAGWQGPYLESPLTTAMNPSGGSINLYASVAVQGNAGFDIDGDAANDITAAGCTLWMSGLTQADAQAIDNVFDKGVRGNWYSSGRVKWNSSNNYCWVLTYW